MDKRLHDSSLSVGVDLGGAAADPRPAPSHTSVPRSTSNAASSSRPPSAPSRTNSPPLPPATRPSHPAPPSPSSPATLWLNGDVLMCACPDCRAPMTVRLWLMLAECWHCGTSIELTEEQEREAKRLLAEAASRKAQAAPSEPNSGSSAPAPAEVRQPSTSAPAGVASQDAPRSAEAAPATSRSQVPLRPAATPARSSGRPASTPSSHPQGPPRPVRRTAAHSRSVPDRVRSAMGRRTPPSGVSVWLHDLFSATPAWLISLVFHLILLTLLALWSIPEDVDDQLILLSTTIDKQRLEGGEVEVVDPQDELVFDLPLPKDLDLSDQKVREVVARADQDARELRLDPGVNEPDLPSLDQVKSMVGGRGGTGSGRSLAARDPRIRTDVVKQEGGTTMTEAAVARGLRWLAMHQDKEGHWSLNRFNRHSGCSCSGTGSVRSDSAGTSLALLPFLGAGQTHLVGKYQETVSHGLRWLLAQQRENGDLRGNSEGNAGMYAHGQGAIVLCEAYLMTGDETLRAPAQKAIDFIAEAQHAGGGWRYSPGQPGDTSVVGWQLMALQSARAANLTVPPETWELANIYLDSVSHERGSRYSYMAGQAPTHVMTAEALLCRMYMGWNLDTPGMQQGIDYLIEKHLPRERDPNIYYWYYATQTLHHAGGKPWETWNAHMREILVESQERRGHAAGSWAPRGDHAGAGGRIYMTSLAVCSLEVYYRHLPIFRQLELK